jgi:phosphopantetheinyl transferase
LSIGLAKRIYIKAISKISNPIITAKDSIYFNIQHSHWILALDLNQQCLSVDWICIIKHNHATSLLSIAARFANPSQQRVPSSKAITIEKRSHFSSGG